MSRKKPKTLSGIETVPRPLIAPRAEVVAGKNLKPYQGLKQQIQLPFGPSFNTAPPEKT